MRIHTLITSFILATLLFSSQIVLLPGQGLALPWCGCGRCYMAQTGTCTCASPYYYCADDAEAMEFYPTIETQPAQTGSLLENLRLTTINTDSTQADIRLMGGGKCLYGRSRFTLLSNVGKDLKTVPERVADQEHNLIPSISG